MIKNYVGAQSNQFIGRSRELADVRERLLTPECQLLTLTGLGGSGKTRLALEIADSVSARFEHGVVMVALQALSKPDFLASAVAQAVGVSFYGKDEPEAQLVTYLRERSLLLLLDNFEHLLDGATFVSRLLAEAPGIKVLVTSREALNLREEWLYRLNGMSMPPSIYSTALEEYESVQLFFHHARRFQPGFLLSDERESVIRICQQTAGLPLAIELAASWLKGLTAAQIDRAMQHSLDFMSTTTRNVEERHRSMRAVFDQSWNLLSDNERLVFARLSIFSGGFDSEAAQQIAKASLSELSVLVEKSLVQVEPSGWFAIHEMLRQYGMERLAGYGETDAAKTRHSDYYARRMAGYETALKQPDQLNAMRAVERDFENIRLAWEWASKTQQTAHLHAMLNGLYLFGFLRSRYHDTMSMFRQALEQPIADAALLGRLLTRRWGYLHWWYQADYQDALVDIERALDIARAENNLFELALGHLMLAYAMISMQRYGEAVTHLETSKALFERANEPYYVCWVLHRLGYVYSNLNERAKGVAYTEQSLSLARVTHNRLALVICLYNLGSDHILDRDYMRGRHYCAEALEVATETEHKGQIAHALSLLALCAFCQGDFTISETYARRSQNIIEEINLLAFQPYNLSLLILLACMREDYAEGVRLREIAERHSTNLMGYQVLYWSLAHLSCGLGKRAEARTYIERMLSLSDIDTSPAIGSWIVAGAAYTLAEADMDRAVELLAWAWTQPDTALNWVRQWSLFSHLQTQLRVSIGSDAFETLWARGQERSVDDMNAHLHKAFLSSKDAGTEPANQPLLTVREREVLRLMASGLTNQQIADDLVIGAGTVKTHTLSIYRKLDVANRTQAILRAQELGLLHT